MMPLYLQLGELQVPVEVTEARKEISGYTGRSIMLLSGRATANSEASHALFSALLDTQSDEGVPLADGAPIGEYGGKRWRLRQHSMTRSTDQRGGTTYSYSLELREAERQIPDQLEITVEDTVVVVTPHWYREELSDGSLIVNCRVRVHATARETLRRLAIKRLPLYFDVRRPGVSDTPRSMRLGQVRWSRTSADEPVTDTFALTLVERSYDNQSNSSIGNALDQTGPYEREVGAYLYGLAHSLLTSLVAKGVLTQEDVDAMKAEATAGIREREFDLFWHRMDVDAEG